MERKMKYVFAPGCALMSYKPHLAERLKEWTVARYGAMDSLLACCLNRPAVTEGTCVLTPCVTCAATYARLPGGCTSHLLLHDIAQSDTFPFPDYGGAPMSIQDTCASRTMPQAQATVRRLLERMNISLVEPQKTGPRAKCCGQTFYGKLPEERVRALMQARAGEMPCRDVVVYCASCIMSMTQGGRQPRYILDLLFGEPTLLADGIGAWNRKLADFRKTHSADR